MWRSELFLRTQTIKCSQWTPRSSQPKEALSGKAAFERIRYAGLQCSQPQAALCEPAPGNGLDARNFDHLSDDTIKNCWKHTRLLNRHDKTEPLIYLTEYGICNVTERGEEIEDALAELVPLCRLQKTYILLLKEMRTLVMN